MLADLGAEVVKVERPGLGDETRGWGPPFLAPGLSAYYLSCNRGKWGLGLDLSRPEGQRLLHQLAEKADVLLENFRADSAEKLGLGPSRLHAINPTLIVCSISGFGRTGPMKGLPGYDFAIQALSGLMSITGPADGQPFKVGVAVVDVLTGLYAASAVLACVVARQRTGHGYFIDLSLLDCAVAAQVNVAQAYLTSGKLPARQGNAHLQIVPYQLFATSDGWLVLAVGNDGQWQKFCQIAAPQLGKDARFETNPLRVQNREMLVPLVDRILREKTTSQWEEMLTKAGVPNAPVWNYAELFAHPQAAARGLSVTIQDPEGRPVDLLGHPFHIAAGGSEVMHSSDRSSRLPPTLGQDSAEILERWLGMESKRVEQLRDAGVI
jgi:crotonobetainyl-CoA:carnitine CoA-transferase CaiB-like acyl-CoA transferase